MVVKGGRGEDIKDIYAHIPEVVTGRARGWGRGCGRHYGVYWKARKEVWSIKTCAGGGGGNGNSGTERTARKQ